MSNLESKLLTLGNENSMSFLKSGVLTCFVRPAVRLYCRAKWPAVEPKKVDSFTKKLSRKKPHSGTEPSKSYLEVVAFCTAQEYALDDLKQNFVKDGIYDVYNVSEDLEENVLYVKSKFDTNSSKEVYFFRDGSVIFWNVPTVERYQIFDVLKPFEVKPYDQEMVQEEKEELDYEYVNSRTKIQKGVIRLQADSPNILLEKYTFSNDMVSGNPVRLTREQVFSKTGALFTLRHYINLSSDLLDAPDFYWEREDLEKLFKQMCTFLNIQKRTYVMNEKLNHCCELMDLLSTHLSDKHHVRLEWMIIILIMVEVAFELLHYLERFTS